MPILEVIILYSLTAEDAVLSRAGSAWRLGYDELLACVDYLLAAGNKQPCRLYQLGTLIRSNNQSIETIMHNDLQIDLDTSMNLEICNIPHIALTRGLQPPSQSYCEKLWWSLFYSITILIIATASKKWQMKSWCFTLACKSDFRCDGSVFSSLSNCLTLSKMWHDNSDEHINTSGVFLCQFFSICHFPNDKWKNSVVWIPKVHKASKSIHAPQTFLKITVNCVGYGWTGHHSSIQTCNRNMNSSMSRRYSLQVYCHPCASLFKVH